MKTTYIYHTYNTWTSAYLYCTTYEDLRVEVEVMYTRVIQLWILDWVFVIYILKYTRIH